VATQVRTIFDQANADAVHAQYDRVIEALDGKYPDAAEHLEAARADLLAYPREIWRQVWSNNPQERWAPSHPSGMTVSNRALIMLADALRRRRTQLGTSWRRLDVGEQALLVVAHLRKARRATPRT
jgi:putative transposase